MIKIKLLVAARPMRQVAAELLIYTYVYTHTCRHLSLSLSLSIYIYIYANTRML